MNTIRLCPGCGAPLMNDAPGGLCPQCLLKTQVIGEEELAASAPRALPVPGSEFGNYRIEKLLGHGGMGEVYEAEHVATGRRVALKVMRHTLASEQDRKRFLREGRLAASVNHPNVVYIHGSEEIGGAPAIAMELVHGGTLKDRLRKEGPLPVADAVAAALQIVDGLEAAHSAGVLHRDIKPANCFVAADGTVKVGDFGLSVSTLARGESLITASGAVMGTPAYASPEQLRGEELDVTSDIYSVGATLYHLLTGKTPFNATDFIKLITEVLDKQPASPKTLRPEIPTELSRILLRCLAKDRKARFQSYEELRDALLPFRAQQVVPGRPGIRFLADLLDSYIAYAPSLVFVIYWSFDPLDQFSRQRTLSAGLIAAALYAWHFLYYSVAEGLWGAGLGKMICGLRVVGRDGQPPGVPRALLRTAVYTSSSILPPLLAMALFSADRLQKAAVEDEFFITDFLWPLLHICLFLTMRRRNGYAAIHDLLSRTRVIVRPRAQVRPPLPASVPPARETVTPLHLGPYEVTATLWRQAGEELLLGFDPALRRRVWIYRRPAGSPVIPVARHDLSRPARLRWLSGGETDQHIWDVYEAVEGAPLRRAAATAQPWNAVRFWLHDLAAEMAALLDRRDLTPLLSLDHVWISTKGHALLLEFPCPDLPGFGNVPAAVPSAALDETAVQQFLHTVAQEALEGTARTVDGAEPAPVRVPVPAPALSFLQSLARGSFSEARIIVGNLESLLSKPAEITRSRRAASLVLVPVLLLMFAFIGAGIIAFDRSRKEKAWHTAFPGEPSLALMNTVHDTARDVSKLLAATSNDLQMVEGYFVQHYSHLITNDALWTDRRLGGTLAHVDEERLRRMVRDFKPMSAELAARADREVPLRLDIQAQAQRSEPMWVIFFVVLGGFIFFALIDLASVLMARTNPVLRLFGIAVVDALGRPVTRLRLLGRTLIVWLVAGPAVVALTVCAALLVPSLMRSMLDEIGMSPSGYLPMVAWPVLTLGLLTLGFLIAFAVRHPARSLQDRMAGTALVPR